jgi:feruloyl-CoA synthase
MKFLAHFGTLVHDVVLAGPDRDFVTALIFPAPDTSAGELRSRLNEFAGTSTGSSTLVRRAMLMDEPPSIEAGEITDKGTLNQRAVREHRAAAVEELYQTNPSARVIRADSESGLTS